MSHKYIKRTLRRVIIFFIILRWYYIILIVLTINNTAKKKQHQKPQSQAGDKNLERNILKQQFQFVDQSVQNHPQGF